MIPFLFIPTHRVAQWLMTTIRNLLNAIGLQRDPNLESVLYIVVVAAVAVLLGWLIRKLVLFVVRKVMALRHTRTADSLNQAQIFTKCSHIIPPVVMLSLVPLSLDAGTFIRAVVWKGLFVYLMYTVAMGINSIIMYAWMRYDERENTRNLPLKGVANTFQGIVWIIAAIITVSVIVDKSPMALLAGLGAFAAALMLIFKDSILGFVSAIQLSQNDMVRIGDWIVVPGTPGNGIVLDMTLTTVKIQNFDNTIVTCPPYTLVQSSFQNWRGMSDTGARRVSYDFPVDNATIKMLSDDDVKRLSGLYPSLADWCSKVAAAPDHLIVNPGLMTVNGTVQTNLGLFRAMISQYLVSHPRVCKTQQMLVRVNPPTEEGTTLNIYCFTDTTEWTSYQAIVSDIMEYVVASAPDFGLRIHSPIGGHVIYGAEPEK